MNENTYGFDISSLPYKDINITNESSILFLRSYSSERFWRFLFAINITDSQFDPPICLSCYGERLFHTDTSLYIEKNTLGIIQSRVCIEKKIVGLKILQYKERQKREIISGNIQTASELADKIKSMEESNFPSLGLKNEIDRQIKVVEKFNLERKLIIEALEKRASIVRSVENGFE